MQISKFGISLIIILIKLIDKLDVQFNIRLKLLQKDFNYLLKQIKLNKDEYEELRKSV